ncbi:MAG: YybS family protein, partial [Geobacteraceae bacterium]|nr:YybS family protein [Geobacteraceae bacterium]
MEQIVSQSNGGQKLAAVLIGTLGSGLLFSASLAVPVIGFVSAFLAPVPLGLARIKGGSLIAGFSALLVTLLLAVLFSPPIGAWYAVQCGLIGL